MQDFAWVVLYIYYIHEFKMRMYRRWQAPCVLIAENHFIMISGIKQCICQLTCEQLQLGCRMVWTNMGALMCKSNSIWWHGSKACNHAPPINCWNELYLSHCTSMCPRVGQFLTLSFYQKRLFKKGSVGYFNPLRATSP